MQPKKRPGYDPLSDLRTQVKELALKKHRTLEKFCYEEDIQKSTVSRLVNGQRTEFRIETLMKVAAALGKKLVIRIE